MDSTFKTGGRFEHIATLAGALFGASLLLGCARESTPETLAEVRLALASKTDLVSSSERIEMDRVTAESLRVQEGEQVELEREDGTSALFTVAALSNASAPMVRLSLAARKRLGIDPGAWVRLDRWAPSDESDTSEAKLVELFVEGSSSEFAVIAPHGGKIEEFTDQQAAAFRDATEGKATMWATRGFATTGAFSKWHIASTDLSERSFPKMKRALEKRYNTVVAFHGSSESGILIGGLASAEEKELLRASIAKVVNGMSVRIADANDELDGSSAQNIMNRLANGHRTFQIEQSMEARELYGAEIAKAIATTLKH